LAAIQLSPTKPNRTQPHHSKLRHQHAGPTALDQFQPNQFRIDHILLNARAAERLTEAMSSEKYTAGRKPAVMPQRGSPWPRSRKHQHDASKWLDVLTSAELTTSYVTLRPHN
jgi:hypothetical protein